MKTTITIERVKALQAEIDAINSLDWNDIVVTENGKPINIPVETFKFVGLTIFHTLISMSSYELEGLK